MNLKTNKKITEKYAEDYQKELRRRIDLIYSANITNPESLELWQRLRDLEWIKPEIREKWEKALKEKGIELKD